MQSPRLKAGLIGNRRIDPQGDIPVGAVLRAAVHAKLNVESVTFPKVRYIDIGSPRAIFEARLFPEPKLLMRKYEKKTAHSL